ncbi:tetratricopeptide repeat protein [Paenibacillus oenotherae]|uniref:Tetratricopeptide repeat protein n=1 Tax=Paenibacillus oenotherae TaxID=1435645 RepID=A0ABS7D0M6_9BACL|nr:tetratricopeptide repeat protein [Paenibacillus oenotherae]MBW7473415.1 tetratricopeptide repeat protein [Paenibacillus oenotherae]
MDGESSIRKAYEAILSGDFEQALARFEEAIALEPDQGVHYYKCSITCARSGKWQKALHYAEQAVALEPAQEEYRFHLQTVQSRWRVIEAEALLSREGTEGEKAIAMLCDAIRLDPLNLDALLILGAAYAARNRFEEAAVCAKDALRLDPEHSAARRLLADVRRSRLALRTYKQRRQRKRNR